MLEASHKYNLYDIVEVKNCYVGSRSQIPY